MLTFLVMVLVIGGLNISSAELERPKTSILNFSPSTASNCSILAIYSEIGGESYWKIPSFHNTSLSEFVNFVSFHFRLYGVCNKNSLGGSSAHGGVAVLLVAENPHIELPETSFASDISMDPTPRFIHCYFSTTHHMYSDVEV
jgi:hypothetical protein